MNRLPRLPQFRRSAIERELTGLEGHPNGVVSEWPKATRVVMNALATDRWTEDDEACLADLRHEAERYRLFEPDDAPPPPLKLHARAVTATLLALGDSIRLESKSGSPWPEEQPSAAEIAAVADQAETALGLLVEADGVDPGMARMAGLLHVHCAMQLVRLAGVSGKTPALLDRINAHAAAIPRHLALLVPMAGTVKTLARVYTGQTPPSDEAVTAAVEDYRNLWDSLGADYARAEAAADRADASGDATEIRAAIAELEMVWIGLPTGSSVRGRTLTLLADMHLALAASTNDLTLLADVIAIAITAIRTTDAPRTAQGACSILVDCLAMQTIIGHFRGPFAEASAEIGRALARLDLDPAERASLTTAAGASGGMQGAALGDASLRQASRRLTEEAERLLPATAPSATLQPAQWTLHYRTSRSLQHWTAAQALSGGDTEMLPVALRVADKLQRCLADGSGTADQLKTLRQTRKALLRAQRRIERGKPPVAESANRPARSAAERFQMLQGRFPAPLADLRRALARQVDDTRERSRAHQVLGLRLAELYWADPAAGTEAVLRDAATHLNRALVTGEFTLPTTERARLLDLLARCYYESGRRSDDASMRHRAERAARAAIRELAGCVLIAPGTKEALEVASVASQIAARATGWCLADGRHRVAVDLAEAGRGLLLASVVMAGRAQQMLRAVGDGAAADAWRNGTEADRATALDALWDTPGGARLLMRPTTTEISANMLGTRLDGVVYLVPPDELTGGASGQAVIVRPVTDEVEVVALPRLTTLAGTPLDAYLTALERAVTALDAGASGADGFRGLPQGRSWATALDALGRWAYDAIMEPLIAHARGWQPDGLPHLALIPLGRLGGSRSPPRGRRRREAPAAATRSRIWSCPTRRRPGCWPRSQADHGSG